MSDFRNIFGGFGGGLNIILNGPDPGDLGGGEEAEATLDASWAAAMAPNARCGFCGLRRNQRHGRHFSVGKLHHRQQSGAGDDRELRGLRKRRSRMRRRRLFRLWRSRRRLRASPTSSPAAIPAPKVATIRMRAWRTGRSRSVYSPPLPSLSRWEAPSSTRTGTTAPTGNRSTAPTVCSVKSYIPENVWNQSCASAQCGANANILAGGGGASAIFSKPSWQSGVTGIPS